MPKETRMEEILLPQKCKYKWREKKENRLFSGQHRGTANESEQGTGIGEEYNNEIQRGMLEKWNRKFGIASIGEPLEKYAQQNPGLG